MIFLEYIVSQRSVVLFIDGQRSHMTLDIINPGRENSILLASSHNVCTPATGCSCVSISERSLQQICICFSLRKAQLCCCQAWLRKRFQGPIWVCLLSNEKAGFEKSGILQFNPNAIDTAKLLPSTLYKAPSFSSPSPCRASIFIIQVLPFSYLMLALSRDVC